MKWSVVIAVAGFAGCVSCSSSSGDTAKPCNEMFAIGAAAPDNDDVLACRQTDGAMMPLIYALIDCPDGARIEYNQFGWWRTTDRVVQAGEPLADCSGTSNG